MSTKFSKLKAGARLAGALAFTAPFVVAAQPMEVEASADAEVETPNIMIKGTRVAVASWRVRTLFNNSVQYYRGPNTAEGMTHFIRWIEGNLHMPDDEIIIALAREIHDNTSGVEEVEEYCPEEHAFATIAWEFRHTAQWFGVPIEALEAFMEEWKDQRLTYQGWHDMWNAKFPGMQIPEVFGSFGIDGILYDFNNPNVQEVGGSAGGGGGQYAGSGQDIKEIT